VRGLYTRDLALLPLLIERSAGEQAVDVGRDIALRVVVKLQDAMVVRTKQASLRAGGTVTVQGTLAAPVLFGVVQAREGTVTFRRNRFALESATVRFEDPRRIDPIVDVRATTRIRTYDITMDMSGRADDLHVRLSSVPPMAQEDLLGLVALGATREELGRSPGTIFATEAVRLLAEQIFGFDSAGSVVDVFDVDTTAPGGPQLTVGKRLNERTLVSYTGSFAEGGQQKLRVEYQLIGPLLLAGEQGLSGAFAGDIVLRLRFR
jgi:translocation and assembly module TamB